MKSQVQRLAESMRESMRNADARADEAFDALMWQPALIWYAQAREREHMAAQLDLMAFDLR